MRAVEVHSPVRASTIERSIVSDTSSRGALRSSRGHVLPGGLSEAGAESSGRASNVAMGSATGSRAKHSMSVAD